MTLADAAMLVVARGRLMQALPAGGAMVAVAASEDEVEPLLGEGVGIAAINAPESVVISGAQAAANAIADRFAAQGRRVHQLAVSHAFHSPLMEPMLEEFARVAARVQAREPQLGLVSNVTGELAGPDFGSAQYWSGPRSSAGALRGQCASFADPWGDPLHRGRPGKWFDWLDRAVLGPG